MQTDYRRLIKFHRNIKFKIISRFARSKLHLLYLKNIYALYQAVLRYISLCQFKKSSQAFRRFVGYFGKKGV